jgi:hypothetical protein
MLFERALASAIALSACAALAACGGDADKKEQVKESALQSDETLSAKVLSFGFEEGQAVYALGNSLERADARYFCSMNGEPYLSCLQKGAIPKGRIKSGRNVFQVQVIVGNKQAAEPASHVLNYDPNPPAVAPIAAQPQPPALPTTGLPNLGQNQAIIYQHSQDQREITFNTRHQTDQNVGYECSFGASSQQDTWFPCRSPVLYDSFELPVGQAQLKVRGVQVQGGQQSVVETYPSFSFQVPSNALDTITVQSPELNVPVAQQSLVQGVFPISSQPVDFVNDYEFLQLKSFQLVLFNPHHSTSENIATVELRINGRSAGARAVPSGIGVYTFTAADWSGFTAGSTLKSDIESIAVAFYGPEVRLVSYQAEIKRSNRKYENRVDLPISGRQGGADMLGLAGLRGAGGQIKPELQGKVLGDLIVTMRSVSNAGISQVNVVESGPWSIAPNYKNYRFLVTQVPRTFRLPVNRPLGTDLSEVIFFVEGRVHVEVVGATVLGQRAYRMNPVAEFDRYLDALSQSETKVLFNVGFSSQEGAYLVPVGNDRFCGRRLTEIIVDAQASYANMGVFQSLNKLRISLNRSGRGGQFGPGAAFWSSEQWISPSRRLHTFEFRDNNGERGVYLDCSGPYRVNVADVQLLGAGSVTLHDVFAVIEP